MFAVNPVMLLENVPESVPLVVWGSLNEGFWLVLQQIPLTVTGEPPSELMVPPLTAPVGVIEVAGAVEIDGTTCPTS